MTRDRLDEIVAMVNAQHANLVAITGDFVTGRPAIYASDLVQALSPLHAPDGVLGVMGNHDYTVDPNVVRYVMLDSGILNVSNSVHTLQRGTSLLHIAGVDDVWRRQDKTRLVMDKLPNEGAAIVLVHEPDFADATAATGRFDLQISGHSHGGQVIVPFYGPLRLPQFGRKYPFGTYQIGQMLEYTNRGVGMVRPTFAQLPPRDYGVHPAFSKDLVITLFCSSKRTGCTFRSLRHLAQSLTERSHRQVHAEHLEITLHSWQNLSDEELIEPVMSYLSGERRMAWTSKGIRYQHQSAPVARNYNCGRETSQASGAKDSVIMRCL